MGGGLGGRFQSGRKHWHLIYYHRDKYPLVLFLLNIADGSFIFLVIINKMFLTYMIVASIKKL